jgi:hypothetical protein
LHNSEPADRQVVGDRRVLGCMTVVADMNPRTSRPHFAGRDYTAGPRRVLTAGEMGGRSAGGAPPYSR